MYVGRIVAVGKTPKSDNVALYRVSSRSFPNRETIILEDKVVIVPRQRAEDDLKKNPYISYNAMRISNDHVVASNGSHTDPITEKLELGLPPRDALSISLLALDFERDAFNTPRIAAIVPKEGRQAWLGIIRKDALVVKSINMEAGKVIYVATYELSEIDSNQYSEFKANSANEAARAIIEQGDFQNFENPVTSAAAIVNSGRFVLGSHTVESKDPY